MKLRLADFYTIQTDKDTIRCWYEPDIPLYEVRVNLTFAEGAMRLTVYGEETPLKRISLRWNFTEEEKRTDFPRILGDAYERAYGDLAWRGIEPERIMPWYMLVSDGSDQNPDTRGRLTEGFGVRVQCGGIITWQYDREGITMHADIRCGGEGVILGGRTLNVCDIVFGEYRDVSAFEAGRAFCREMCPSAKLPDHKVYGSNNWYYAYGKSSHEEILADTDIVAGQCASLTNRPYMVIDDGWQKYNVDGPWTETKAVFPDMKRLAAEMRQKGVRPGIWVRYLIDSHHEIPEARQDWYFPHNPAALDPSHPEVIDYVRRTTRMLRDWGYDLIKHDYSTFDLFGKWGMDMGASMARDCWHFFDRSRTSAEIIVDFYRSIREAAGEDCVLIGCNTISHLCAGIFELNRTGDDTSGREWKRTRKMGVNTLAFRLMQNGIFYMADADCVGITEHVPWPLNRLWLDVLARSGSPLFVSCKPGVLGEAEQAELRAAWAENSRQENASRPLDWMENAYPALWEIDGETVRYDWYGDEKFGR